jgi:hypothetical protein
LFQQDLDRLQGWCLEKKYDLNAGKNKSILFSRGSKPVMFQYVIDDSDLEHIYEINDIGVYADCYSKGPGFESRVSHGPFQKVKNWIDNPVL